MILDGDGLVDVDGLDPVRVTVGAVVLIPAGCRQRIRNVGENDLIFLALCTPRFEGVHYHEVDDNESDNADRKNTQ